MKRSLNAFEIGAVVWMSVAVLISGLAGMVLCIGPDGHLAVEMDHAGHCHDAAATDDCAEDAGAAVVDGSAASCCDECVDVSLPRGPMVKVSSRVKPARLQRQSEVRAVATTPVALDDIFLQTVCAHSYRERPGPATAPIAHRTVVLRI